ncbi:enoyl-CoA hydratase/isomerase family protein [Amycolatopsis rubida]|uniref:Enoyl-CoA hydratase/isomerase family protein n=1 Tax=Amycolatopsis rubida TaxID=112413 RepID=A0ABX0C2V2_9PSEU|nr:MULTISPECIES: enoyl-CoA hydratase/isomerase family protein [Amycolatopsis]MYW96139.1 enoyl-CoA hydratase/isomerase family protein [Amycolatopsis rubida]NEC61130.1 enoyl-CoA hydratase/isomerase family protein [Amycolatopsis rubida]OAP23347.1 Carnitinyl-CoA dehydratase [Amycolatopsis sp. M39]
MNQRNGGAPTPKALLSVDEHPDTHVAVVTFSRGRNNYLDHDLVDRIAGTIEKLPERGVRAVVLRTTSRHFCGGADFAPRSSGAPPRGNIAGVVPRLFRLPIPVVAAVGGAAVGGGLGLALTADFRVCTPSSYFLANFTRLGINEGFGLSLSLPRLIGPQRAAEMLYTARRVNGEEAVCWGLGDRLAQPSDLDEAAYALAADIAASAPAAVAVSRAALRAELTSGIEDALRAEMEQQRRLMESEDFREGVRAWGQRRPPVFRGAVS